MLTLVDYFKQSKDPYQKGIIRRYYEHRDTLALQKLAEIVSDLYGVTDEKKLKRVWRSALSQMIAAGVHAKRAQEIVDQRDLAGIAKIVQTMT